MKKYLLTALLGVFGLFTAFASADTVGNFSSDSSIKTLNYTNGSINAVENFGGDYPEGDIYICISSSDIPYYYGFNVSVSDTVLVNSSVYCPSSPIYSVDNDLYICTKNSDSDYCYENGLAGTIYYSKSPITYSSSSEGGSSEGSSSLISGGTAVFSGIISSLGSAVSEFIPYVAYIGIGLLGAIIGFVAIKRLINRVRAKIFGTFSGGRRR